MKASHSHELWNQQTSFFFLHFFFHQEFCGHNFVKGMNGSQTCCTTYLLSKSQFMILSHFRVSSRDSGGKWRAGSWLSPLCCPALFQLTWKELCAHPHNTLAYIFRTLFKSLPQQLLLGHLWPNRTYECLGISWGHMHREEALTRCLVRQFWMLVV